MDVTVTFIPSPWHFLGHSDTYSVTVTLFTLHWHLFRHFNTYSSHKLTTENQNNNKNANTEIYLQYDLSCIQL